MTHVVQQDAREVARRAGPSATAETIVIVCNCLSLLDPSSGIYTNKPYDSCRYLNYTCSPFHSLSVGFFWRPLFSKLPLRVRQGSQK